MEKRFLHVVLRFLGIVLVFNFLTALGDKTLMAHPKDDEIDSAAGVALRRNGRNAQERGRSRQEAQHSVHDRVSDR